MLQHYGLLTVSNDESAPKGTGNLFKKLFFAPGNNYCSYNNIA